MQGTDRFLNIGEVVRITGLSKSEVYRRISAGTFPAQRRLSARKSVWSQAEVQAWMNRVMEGSL